MTPAHELTDALNGKWYTSYGMALCPAHDNRRTPSLSIGNGNDGKLLIKCFAGCSFLEIKDALERLGFWRHESGAAVSSLHQQKRLNNSIRARRIWDSSVNAGGTLAEKYLRQRKITARIPSTIRFNKSCWHSSGTYLPAMISKISGAQDFGIHRTFLDASGSKTSLVPQKAMLGTASGGYVKLSDGGNNLLVCEGIETGLSLLSGLISPVPTVWACLSTSGLKNLNLPQNLCHLIIATDGDHAGRQAGRILAERAVKLGTQVDMLHAPDHSDFNDVLNALGEIDED